MSKRAAAGRRVGFLRGWWTYRRWRLDDCVVERRLEVGEELEDGEGRGEKEEEG